MALEHGYVVAVGNALESTPEGLYWADRMRRAADAQRLELESILRPEAIRELERREVEAFLHGRPR